MKDPGSYANPINSSFQKFRTTSNDVYVLYGELGHLPSELNLVPTMHKFEVHYRVVGDQLVEVFRQQPPAH